VIGQPGGTPPREPLSVHFHPSLAVAVHRIAACDDALSVGEWVRGLVEQEIRRRTGRCAECGAEREAS
jgi:hypothetical protein